MEAYTLADAQTLNTLKQRVREIIRVLDNSPRVYPETLEAHEFKHAVVILLSELHLHGLLPAQVSVFPETPPHRK